MEIEVGCEQFGMHSPSCIYISREALMPAYFTGYLSAYYDHVENIFIARLRRVISSESCEIAYELEVEGTILSQYTNVRRLVVCGIETSNERELWRSLELSERHELAVARDITDGQTPTACDPQPFSHAPNTRCYLVPAFNYNAKYIVSWGERFGTMSFEPYLIESDALRQYVRSLAVRGFNVPRE